MTARTNEELRKPTTSWHGWVQLLISVVVLVVGLGKVLRDVEEHALILKDHENRLRTVEICTVKVETTLTYIDKRMSQIAADIQEIANSLNRPASMSYYLNENAYTPDVKQEETQVQLKQEGNKPKG